jgi:hypothetical protein
MRLFKEIFPAASDEDIALIAKTFDTYIDAVNKHEESNGDS